MTESVWPDSQTVFIRKGHEGGTAYRSERMATKKSRGLVSYDGLPTVIKNFFKILPETEVKEPRKRVRKRKGV